VDYERLGDDAEKLTGFIDNRAFMRIVDGHCAALTYEAETGHYLCSVYEKRPDVCRWLQRGSGQCGAERHEKGDRPIQLRLARERES
jgi:Fe-S-cluster containining protein